MFRPISDASIRSQTPPSEYNAAPLDFGRFHPISGLFRLIHLGWFNSIQFNSMNYTHTTSFLTTFTANEMEKIIIWGSRKSIFYMCKNWEISKLCKYLRLSVMPWCMAEIGFFNYNNPHSSAKRKSKLVEKILVFSPDEVIRSSA